MFFSQKTSWIILVSLFTFDNIFSYYAITQLDAHEANILIADLVETYPLLYFACIPITVLIMYGIMVILRRIFRPLFQKYAVGEEGQKSIILTGFVIFWAIGNSLMNFLFMVGMKVPGYYWDTFLLVGVVTAVGYTSLALKMYDS